MVIASLLQIAIIKKGTMHNRALISVPKGGEKTSCVFVHQCVCV